MNDTAVMIARTEAASAIEDGEERTLEERLRVAMNATRHHWMATSEDDQFRAAVEAVYLSATDDEREVLERSASVVRDLGALMSGVPVDLAAVAAHADDETVPLLKLWREADA